MIRLLLFLFLPIALAGCKKTNKSTPGAGTAYDFTFTNIPASGAPASADQYTFAFTTTAPAGSATTWDFGDGSSSTDFAPHHLYFGAAIRSVTLIVNGDTAHTITKSLDVSRFVPHSFSWSGTPLKDSPVTFHSNVHSDSTFLWDFGDGTTTSDAVPVHIFHASGTYNVKLSVNGNAAASITKSIVICNDPVYTQLIAGIRTWHDTFQLAGLTAFAVYPRQDTAFSLTYINPVQIQYYGRNIYYAPASSTSSTLYFESSYLDNYGNTHSISVTYYHINDSLHLHLDDQLGVDKRSWEDWITP